ncbi:MAG: hypothetical protein IH853_14460 [Bacteroidetes bacterium]|nr:hypothetical protein [Bacteroidota bacterium]
MAEEELGGQIPLDSSACESIAEKLARKMEEHLRSATQAFADQEFAAAFQTLDRLPESRRTPALRELHRQCLELKEAQKHIETAERSSANGDYDFAVRTLEKIPEYVRSNIISDKIEEAHTLVKIGTHLERARQYLANFNYDAAVRSLETVPEEDRVDGFTTIWNEANEKRSLVRKLQTELKQKWDELKGNPSVDLCVHTFSLIDQLLELHPNDESLKEQRNQTDELQQRVRHRDEQCAVAQERFDELQYAEVVELLQQIDAELRPGKVAQLKAEAVNS